MGDIVLSEQEKKKERRDWFHIGLGKTKRDAEHDLRRRIGPVKSKPVFKKKKRTIEKHQEKNRRGKVIEQLGGEDICGIL